MARIDRESLRKLSPPAFKLLFWFEAEWEEREDRNFELSLEELSDVLDMGTKQLEGALDELLTTMQGRYPPQP